MDDGVVGTPPRGDLQAKQQQLGASMINTRTAPTATARTRRIDGVSLTKEEQDQVLEDLRKKDDETGQKTLSRRVVENYLSKYDWYWPRRNEKGAPQLSKAWAHYEHNILPRHITGATDTEHVFRMAERGEFEEETELYPHFTLPQSAFVEWGSGMDLYFISLWFFAILMFVCGCINILSIDYFASTAYNDDTGDAVSGFLRSSAVCTNVDWVVCSTCTESQWFSTPNNAPERFATAIGPDGKNGTLVQRNLCQFEEFRLGWPNYLTLWVVLISVGVFGIYLRAREVRFDEDKVTTSDYSVYVLNPPPDAKDPDEWRDFFEKYTDEGDQITTVTVALDNEALINKLATRRVYQNYLRMKLPPDTDFKDEDALLLAIEKHREYVASLPVGLIGKLINCVRPIFKLIGMMLNANELHEQIGKLTEQVKELQEKEYHATKVFVTFETERSQRNALEALKVGQLDLMANRLGAVSPENHFRGDQLLEVVEPDEPSAIRYMELSTGFISRMLRHVITMIITVGLIAFSGWSVWRVRETSGAYYSGNLTTIFNSSMPSILKFLLMVERHPDEGSYQRSVYLKLTLYRWTLSGLLAALITPFTHTLGHKNEDMVPTVAALLISDSWLSPLMRISDYTTNLKKHVLAPRARTQDEMNSWFTGSWFQLGERYTDFTKVLFLVFFYSALFPSGFFFGFFILITQYYMDKFSLVRIWQPTPRLGADLANFSRIFFTIAVLAFAVVSSMTWAQYPYDKLCVPNDGRTATVGTYLNPIRPDKEMATIWESSVEVKVFDITVTDPVDYVPCGQNFRAWKGTFLPATPRVQTQDAGWFAAASEDDLEWMSDEQTWVTRIYGWTAVVLLILGLIGLFAGGLYNLLLSQFRGVYSPEGNVQDIDFSSNVEIFAYVPEVRRGGEALPFLCCDVDDFDENMIAWADRNNSYDYHNLIFDVPHKSLRRQETTDDEGAEFDNKEMFGFHRARYPGKELPKLDYSNSIYSLVKHYPTKWQRDIAKENGYSFDD